MSKTVLIATRKPFAPAARERMTEMLEAAGLTVRLLEAYRSPSELDAAMAGVQAVIVRSDAVTAARMAGAPGLRLVVRAGAGFDNVDVAYAQAKGIVVENTPGQNANAVAELALQLMLAGVRPLDGTPGRELRGRTLAVHGFGNIGRIVARLGRSLGMRVKAFDMNVDVRAARECGVELANSVAALYEGADVASLHLPENAGTRGSIGAALLERMAADGVLVNTARAALVNEDDLAALLAARPAFRYATDVAPSAGLAERFPGRVLATPRKQGAQTLEANLNAGLAAARQTIAYFKSGDTTFCVYKLIPPHLKDYTFLAVQLGKLNAVFVPRPDEILFTGYGELNAYREVLAEYVLKGLFTRALGEEGTPHLAVQYARDRGIRIVEREPDDSRGYGNALTIDFVSPGGVNHSSRGRIDEGQLEASRIGEFKARMPLDPALYVLATYKEGPGMADRVGRPLIEAGYNRVRLGAGPSMDNTRAQAYFQVEKGGVDSEAQLRQIEAIAAHMRALPDVHDVKVIDLRG